MKANPEVLERELLAAAERCAVLSDVERLALADRLADLAMRLSVARDQVCGDSAEYDRATATFRLEEKTAA